MTNTLATDHMQEQLTQWMSEWFEWALDHGTKIIFIAIIAYLLKAISKKFIQRIVKAAVSSEKFVTEEAETKRMNTLVRIFSWTISTLIIATAAMMIIQEFGVKMGPILASAGIVGVAIGFGGQYLVKDVITGFFIIFENQYRIGDVVDFEGYSGTVEDINLRITTLRDMNGTVHYIPHGEIKKVSNFAKKFARVNLDVGVAYDSNLEHVIEVVNKVGMDMAEDPAWKDSINQAPKFLRVDSLGDSSISIKIFGETKPLKQWEITGELRKRIKEAFEREGIEIPFPQTVIHTMPKKLD